MQKQAPIKKLLTGALLVGVIVTGWFALRPELEKSAELKKNGTEKSNGFTQDIQHSPSSGSFAPAGKDAIVAPLSSITASPEAAIQASREPSQWASQPGKIDDKGYKTLGFVNSQPLLSGQYAEAFVETKATGQKFRLTPNQAGEYQRVYVKPEESIAVKVTFANGKPGSKVAIASLDGGRLANGEFTDLITMDDQGSVDFAYRSSPIEGIHRVKVMSQNGEVKLLDFWVGNEHILHARGPS